MYHVFLPYHLYSKVRSLFNVSSCKIYPQALVILITLIWVFLWLHITFKMRYRGLFFVIVVLFSWESHWSITCTFNIVIKFPVICFTSMPICLSNSYLGLLISILYFNFHNYLLWRHVNEWFAFHRHKSHLMLIINCSSHIAFNFSPRAGSSCLGWQTGGDSKIPVETVYTWCHPHCRLQNIKMNWIPQPQ